MDRSASYGGEKERRDMQEKINKQYIEAKVNPVIEPMTVALFNENQLDQDIVQFMLNYIKSNFGDRPSINEVESLELQFLRQEAVKLRTAVHGSNVKAPGLAGVSTASDKKDNDYGSSSGSEEDEEFVGSLPNQVSKAPTGPRMSVSAEAFGNFNKVVAYVPPVHHKTAQQIAAIQNRMKGNWMFEALNPKDEKAILDAIVPVTKKQGDVIIKQGDEGDSFYILEKGALTCSKFLKPSDQQETFLKEYVPGETFGELALLYNAPRAATIVCKSATAELWSLDRNTFNHILKTAVQKKREKYDDFMEKVDILKNLDKQERSKLCDAFQEHWFQDGEYIIREGDREANLFFMIMEGNAIATKITEPGKPAEVVKKYQSGGYFGERALLKDEPRAASIIAQGEACIVSLDRAAFKRLLGPIENILGRNEAEYRKWMH